MKKIYYFTKGIFFTFFSIIIAFFLTAYLEIILNTEISIIMLIIIPVLIGKIYHHKIQK